MKKSHVSKWILGLLFALSVTQVSAAESAIKQQLAKEGFKFIKQIDAPSHMTGWAGICSKILQQFLLPMIKNIILSAIYIMPKAAT